MHVQTYWVSNYIRNCGDKDRMFHNAAASVFAEIILEVIRYVVSSEQRKVAKFK